MAEEKVINLSQATKFKLKDKVISVYPLCLEDYVVVAEKLKKVGDIKDVDKVDAKKQVAVFTDIVYSIIKDNNDIKKEELGKLLTLVSCVKIIQASVGTDLLAGMAV